MGLSWSNPRQALALSKKINEVSKVKKLRSQNQTLLYERQHSVSGPALTNISQSASSQVDTGVLATTTSMKTTTTTRVMGVDVPMTQQEVDGYVEDAMDSDRIPRLLPQPRPSPCSSTQIDDPNNEDESQNATFSIIDHQKGSLQADHMSCERHSNVGKFRLLIKFNCDICVKIWKSA